MMTFILAAPIVLLIVVLVGLIIFAKKEESKKELIDFPLVSILVAARNEEDNIARCLTSLINLDYPKHSIEILVGDDSSEDKTYDIVKDLASQHSTITLFEIKENIGRAKGKANVLAQLAHKARGDYFLITDADIIVPKEWAKTMVRKSVEDNIDILTGVTIIEGSSLFHRMQNVDWIYSLGMVKVVTDFKLPVTAMGNNMLITKKAYEEIGGYENIPFSVTEDFALFKKVLQNGGSYYNSFVKNTLALSRPISSFNSLLKQRKRWMRGAFQTPWYIVFLLVLQANYYPFIVGLVFVNIKIATMLFLLKYLVQGIFIHFFSKKIDSKIHWLDLFLYEMYSSLLSLTLLFYYFLPTGVVWKGRRY